MLQAMNTGHDGSLSTIHSNTPRDALARVETMVLMAGYDLPVRAIREQVSSALECIIHLERLEDGSRRVTSITEVQGMESDVITLQELFKFQIDEVTRDGTIVGGLRADRSPADVPAEVREARHLAAARPLPGARTRVRRGRTRDGGPVKRVALTRSRRGRRSACSAATAGAAAASAGCSVVEAKGPAFPVTHLLALAAERSHADDPRRRRDRERQLGRRRQRSSRRARRRRRRSASSSCSTRATA